MRERVCRGCAVVFAAVALGTAILGCVGGDTSSPRDEAPRSKPTPPVRTEVPVEDRGVPAAEAMPYEVDGRSMLGHLAWYSNWSNRPMLILLHDGRGIDAWVRQRASTYAAMGYVVVCPDLVELGEEALDGRVTANVEGAIAAAMTAIGRTADRPAMGAVGWGVGGTHALTLARTMNLTMIVTCYGRVIAEEEALMGVSEPVLGIYGGKDERVPMVEIVAFKEAMRRLGGTFSGQVWNDEGRDFMRLPADAVHVREADLEIVRWMDDYMPSR